MLSYLLSLMWIDLASPTAISTEVVLLSMVKKKWHTVVYLVSMYLWYVFVSFGIYVGVDIYLKDLYLSLYSAYPMLFGIIKLIISIGAFVGFVFMIRYIVKVFKKEAEISLDSMLKFKTVNPVFLVILALGQVLLEMPTCYPILTFIGIMAANSIPQISALGYIAIFGTVSVLPSAVVYGLSYTLSDKAFTKVVNVINRIFSYMCIIFIPIILGIIVWWCFTTGIVDVGLF